MPDGVEQTAMTTARGEVVRVAFSPQFALVPAGPTASRRKDGSQRLNLPSS